MAQAKMTDRLQIIIEANDKASKTFKNIAAEAKSLSGKLKGMSLKDFNITPKVKNVSKVKSDLKDIKDEVNKLDGKKFSIIPKFDGKQIIADAKKISTRVRSLLSASSSVMGTVGTGLAVRGGAAGTVLVQDFMQKQTELAKLQNQTGLADKEFEKLGKTAKDVFNTGIPNSMEVARDAISLVYKSIGDVPNLDEISLKVVGISETFDKANVEVVRAADQMKTNMGGTFEEALNIITQSFQKAPDYMDDLLDTFNEYGVQAKKAGYTAEGFAETLLSAKQAGAFNFDKPADSLKEFAIRLQSGDKNIKDSYARVRKNLGEENRNFEEEFASDSAEIRQKALKDFTTGVLLEQDKVFRTQMLTGAFGTMFEDVGEDAIRSFVDVKDTIDLTKDSAQGLVDTLNNNPATQITKLAREFKQTASDVLFTDENIKGFFDYINKNKGPILDGVKAMAKGFGDMAIWIGKNSDKITSLITKIGEFVSTNPQISTWIAGIAVLSPVINSALLALQTFIPMVWKLGSVLGVSGMIGVAAIGILIWSFYTIRDNWRDALAMMSIWWGELMATIRIKWDEFKEMVSGVGDFFVGVWEGVISYVTDMFTNFFGGIGEKFNKVKSWLGFGDSTISAEISPKKTNQLTDLKNSQTGTGGVTVNLNGGVFTDKYSLYNLGQNINQSTRRLTTN